MIDDSLNIFWLRSEIIKKVLDVVNPNKIDQTNFKFFNLEKGLEIYSEYKQTYRDFHEQDDDEYFGEELAKIGKRFNEWIFLNAVYNS